MRVRKIGTWTFNRGGPHGDAGFFVEAIDAGDEYRYAAISYGFLEEAEETAKLERGETVDLALITPAELSSRIPQLNR